MDAHHVDHFIPFGRGNDSEVDFERREDGMQPIDTRSDSATGFLRNVNLRWRI